MMNTQILGRLSPLLRSHSPLSSVFYTRTSLRFSRSLYPTHLTSNPLAGPLCPTPSNPSIWIFYSPFTHTPSFRRYEDECNRDPDSPPKLFVVQPRVRPEKILQAKLNEALNLANSLEVQRDGYFKTEFSEKKLPPHVVVHDPLSRSRKGRADKYFGPGTVENIKCHINALETDDKLDAVFVNAVLTGTQQRNLERAWNKPVLDRIGLIIMIFNAHAYTNEAKLQAELAALMYQKTRLVRVRGPDGRYTFGALGEAEVVSARGRGGSMGRGFLSGAGETELELQRRRISERRLRLLAEIDEVRRTRALQRNARKRRGGLDGQELPTVAIVGYTNAGKSTLVSVLSDSDLYSDDRLFATVDPRLRSVTLPSGKIVLLSDTVGFISDLPVQLVEAFHATLEEVVEAELLVHVVDSSAPNLDEQRCAVLQVLKQIGVSEDKIQNMIEVWNKIDIQDDRDWDEYLDDGEDTEAENFTRVEDDTASELSLGKHGGGSISRVEDDNMASELSPQESEEGNNRNSNGRWLGDEEIDDQRSDYSDGWLALGDSEVCSEDWVYSSMGWAFDQQTQEPFSELMGREDSDSQSKPTPPVKASAITGVGLQELLELIDEKIGAIVENRDSNRKAERFEFDRKWRPPRPGDDDTVVEK